MASRRRPLPLAGLLLLAALAAWVLYLDRTVTARFDGRRWDLPAQVYARPLELYAGLALGAADLQRELRRLGYARVATAPARPGTFAVRGNRVSLVTRAFTFTDGAEPPRALRLEFAGRRLQSLADPRGDVALARLDPLLMGSIFPSHGEDRLVVGPTEVPPLLREALKAVEDRRFDDHHGIDAVAIGRALLANLRAGEVTQGGSTLTQQLVKNFFLDNRQTLGRKLREAVMAVILELHYSKAEILNAYINEIYMGQDGKRAIHGFGLASRFYFSRPLDELDLHQLALLVALVRGPGYYNPVRHPDRARERRDLVLDIMAEAGLVTPVEAAAAAQRELETWDSRTAGASYYPAYLQLVRRQLARQYRDADLTNTGLRIFTALDPLIQAVAEQELAAGLGRLDQRATAHGPPLAGAAVVTSSASGEVLAVVGDRQAGADGFNRALDAQRQIGSLVKPAVYLAALQSGRYTLASSIADEPVSVTLEDGSSWAPENYDRVSHGQVSLLRALAESFNQATVRLGLSVGAGPVADTLAALGAPARPAPYPSLLLGAVEMAPLDVAQIYGTLASGGFRTPLRAVRAVLDSQGMELQRYPMEIRAVADPAAVYQLDQGLVQVLRRGTGRSATPQLPPGLVAAGKTGTSDDYRDSWFAGFTGEHVIVVWVGYDNNRPTGLTGASGALGIWTRIVAGLPEVSYAPPLPDGLEPRQVDYASGLLATADCADVVSLALPANAVPARLPGCAGGLRNLGRRTLEWFDQVLH